MTDTLKEQREQLAEVALEDSKVLEELVARLEGPSRRTRQNAAAVLAFVVARRPEALAPYISAIVDALNRPEAQTRWECLDILTAIVAIDSRNCDKALPGAESALFDEESGPLRLEALRFMCRLGSTTENRSLKTWPLIDEAIQCYHGDPEFQDMLVAVIGFSEGKIAAQVAEQLAERMAFDAKNGRGMLKKRAQHILDNLK